MIMTGAVAGISLVVMQLSKNTATTQVTAFNSADYFSLRSNMDTMLSNGFDCMASLKNTTFKATILKNTPSDIEIWHGDQAGNRSTKFLSGTDAAFKKYGKLEINSIKLSMPDYTAATDFPVGTDESFKAKITIIGDKSKFGKASSFSPIEKEINLTFDTDATGLSTITDCQNSSSGGGGSLGVGQTWQDVTATRAFGTNYINTSGKPIVVSIHTTITGDSGGFFYANIDSASNIPMSQWNKLGGAYPAVGQIIVPTGATYLINYQVTYGAIPALNQWYELR